MLTPTFLPSLPLSPATAVRPALSKRRIRHPTCKAAGSDEPTARISRPDADAAPIRPAEFIDADADKDGHAQSPSAPAPPKQAAAISPDDDDLIAAQPKAPEVKDAPPKRPVILKKSAKSKAKPEPSVASENKPTEPEQIPEKPVVSEEKPPSEDDDEEKKPVDPVDVPEEKPIEAKAEPVAETETAPAPSANGVKMSPEQIEKAKQARLAAQKADEDARNKISATRKQLFTKAEDIVQLVGTKTNTFELGQKARAKAEVFVENTIKLGEPQNASQQDKLKASAATASKSVVATITKGWQETVAPQIVQKLPKEFQDISNKALASAALGLFIAISLLPSLFSGGEKAKPPPKKQIDVETAAIEKKLAKEKRLSSSYSSRSSAQKEVFPPEGKVSPVKPEAPKPPPAPAPPKLSDIEDKAPAPVTPLPPPVVVEKPKVVIEAPKPQQPVNPADVTAPMVMDALKKSLANNMSFVSGASFESLTADPTVVLEVTKVFHRLPESDQRAIAQTCLQSVRALGFENVTLVEAGTGVEVARAGLNVTIEDEAANLRAQLSALRKEIDKLASKNASQEIDIDALNNRLAEERDEFAADRMGLEKTIQTLRRDNSNLLDDLEESMQEISKMPDRIALEERTMEAERKSEKLEDTVEMLSIQVTTARNQQAAAQKTASESVVAVNEANKAKEDAFAAVRGQVEEAQRAANSKADAAIAEAQRAAKENVESANKKVQEAEQALANAVKESTATLDSTTKSYEKQLLEERTAKDKEVQTIQSKYEALLNDVQRKAKAELDALQKEGDKRVAEAQKEAKTTIDAISKERDGAQKEVERSESRASKAATKAEKEKTSLQARIAKLEAKLKNKGSDSDSGNGNEAPAVTAGEQQ